MKNFLKKFFLFFFFYFFSTIRGPESGKEKNRKSGVRTFENLPDFRTGRDVRLSPTIPKPNERLPLVWISVSPYTYLGPVLGPILMQFDRIWTACQC